MSSPLYETIVKKTEMSQLYDRVTLLENEIQNVQKERTILYEKFQEADRRMVECTLELSERNKQLIKMLEKEKENNE